MAMVCQCIFYGKFIPRVTSLEIRDRALKSQCARSETDAANAKSIQGGNAAVRKGVHGQGPQTGAVHRTDIPENRKWAGPRGCPSCREHSVDHRHKECPQPYPQLSNPCEPVPSPFESRALEHEKPFSDPRVNRTATCSYSSCFLSQPKLTTWVRQTQLWLQASLVKSGTNLKSVPIHSTKDSCHDHDYSVLAEGKMIFM